MKKKSATLLNETAIRKFMKLANLGKLTENFVDQLEEKDEELPDDGGPPQVGEPEEAPMGDEMGPPADDLPPPEMGDEEGLEGAGGDEELVTRLVDAIADAIEAESGVAIDVSSGGAPEDLGGEEEVDDGLPPAEDLSPEAPAPEGELSDVEGGDEEEEAPVAEGKEAGKFGGSGKSGGFGAKGADKSKQGGFDSAAKKPESEIKKANSQAGVVAETKKKVSAREKLIAEITERVVRRMKGKK